MVDGGAGLFKSQYAGGNRSHGADDRGAGPVYAKDRAFTNRKNKQNKG